MAAKNEERGTSDKREKKSLAHVLPWSSLLREKECPFLQSFHFLRPYAGRGEKAEPFAPGRRSLEKKASMWIGRPRPFFFVKMRRHLPRWTAPTRPQPPFYDLNTILKRNGRDRD